jgi:hypothetical protein
MARRCCSALISSVSYTICCCNDPLLLQFTPPPPPLVDFEEFADAYGLAYDYDNLWITDTNNVVTGASYSGSVSSGGVSSSR